MSLIAPERGNTKKTDKRHTATGHTATGHTATCYAAYAASNLALTLVDRKKTVFLFWIGKLKCL
jgi:hypothetical protein